LDGIVLKYYNYKTVGLTDKFQRLTEFLPVKQNKKGGQYRNSVSRMPGCGEGKRADEFTVYRVLTDL